MDHRLHLLDSFPARGSDGRTYKVMGYERLVPDDTTPPDRWPSSGVAEYRLDDGARVAMDADGRMRVVQTGVELERC